jgi:hypothetical protein
MATGTLIAESLRTPSTLDDLPLTLHAVERVEAGELSAAQTDAGLPQRWTLLHFEVADADAARLAEALASRLDPVGWYADLGTSEERWVVFADRVFHYRADDPEGRAAAEAHGRSVGVPESQLDWP